MPVRVMLSQITSADLTELRAYHELLREESRPKQDEMPAQTLAEVEATARELLSRPNK
jgi:hypothetical protein